MAERCAECDFTYDLSRASFARDDIRERVADVAAILRSADFDVRTQTRPGVWSPLQYGCHLRDVLLVQRERVLAARRMNRADCAAMGREERAEHDGYDGQDPADVARQLADAAMLFGNVLARLAADDDWDRTVVYHYPETAERSLRWSRCTPCMSYSTTFWISAVSYRQYRRERPAQTQRLQFVVRNLCFTTRSSHAH